MQSVYLSDYSMLNLGRNSSVPDNRKIEGGHVVPPVPSYYRGVVIIDSNSLYGFLVSELNIFVDRCVPETTIERLMMKTQMDMPDSACEMKVGDVIWNEFLVVMRTKSNYIAAI